MKKVIAVVVGFLVVTSVWASGPDQWMSKNTYNNKVVTGLSTNPAATLVSVTNGVGTRIDIQVVNPSSTDIVNIYSSSNPTNSLVGIVAAGGTWSPPQAYPDASGTSYYARSSTNLVAGTTINVVEHYGGSGGTSPSFAP